MAMKHFEKELQDEKKKIEKNHANLKEKEAKYQRMFSLASIKEDATKRKYIIRKVMLDLLKVHSKKVEKGKQWIIFNPNMLLHTREMRRETYIIAQPL